MKSVVIVLILSFCFLISCKNSTENCKSDFVKLDLEKSLSNPKEVSLRSFVDKVTFIPLETTPKALISQLTIYDVTDESFIVKTGLFKDQHIFLFSRATGKFVREISKEGRGPGEFAAFTHIPYNKTKKELYAINISGEIQAYDIDGRNTDKIKIPSWKYNKDGKDKLLIPEIFNARMLDENIYAAYVKNNIGDDTKKIVLFSKDSVVKIFPNYLRWKGNVDVKTRVSESKALGLFYNWDNKLYFFETWCDTLYQVTREKLIPRYYFDWGEFKAPYSKQMEHLKPNSNWCFMLDMEENKNFIYFVFTSNNNIHQGFIEKSTNNITICKPGYQHYCIKDDLNGLMDIVPLQFTQNDEMIYVINPAILINWFKDNPEKAATAKQKLSWLNNIDEFSNPIIAIAKCKE
jgi:hypothetical protein